MDNGDASCLPCAWCRRAVPAGAERCPHCGRHPQPEGLTPLGGEAAAAPPGAPAPWVGRQAPPARDPLVALEERRAEKAAQAAKWVRLSHSGYLRHVLREDQVFAVLLGVLVFQATLSLASLARTELDSPVLISGLAWFALRCAMAIGLMCFQRWAHTALIWAAGVSILWGAVGALRLLLAPLAVQSGIALLVMWVQWVVGIAGGVFMLVVLSERSAYFEGIASRIQPKRTRLRDFLDREYYRRANAPREYAEPQQRQAPPSASRTEPSSVAEPPPADFQGLMPFGGGSAPDLPKPPPRPTRRVEQTLSYRTDPLSPAPGQKDGVDWAEVRQRTGWSQIKVLASEDGLFAALLVALALQALLVVAKLNAVAIIGALAALLAVLMLQPVGYWLALGASALMALSHGAMLGVALQAEGEIAVWPVTYAAAVAALNLFIVVALLARRDRFG